MSADPKEPAYPECGERLRLLRLAVHEMDNQRAFAELYGFTHSQWNNYETGLSRPKPDDALRLKQKFGITTDWIYDGTVSMMPLYLVERMAAIAAEPTLLGSRRKRAS
ncbi:helix-turn-helix transcriptional regulator [uncultured Methylobacterium sp.]|uniref:helix-turn-helix domain-containing protein n=1 Tax=uncultured Methylobacterium sp. TaxID=157278 RepID=UPI0035CAC25D